MNTCFDHASTPTLLLCFILITGYLLGRGSNTSFCFALRSYLVRRFRSSADTREFRKKILLQTPESSEYHLSAQIPVVSALSLTRLQLSGTNSLFRSVIITLCFCPSFWLCQFFFKSSLKTFLFSQTFSSVPLP